MSSNLSFYPNRSAKLESNEVLHCSNLHLFAQTQQCAQSRKFNKWNSLRNYSVPPKLSITLHRAKFRPSFSGALFNFQFPSGSSMRPSSSFAPMFSHRIIVCFGNFARAPICRNCKRNVIAPPPLPSPTSLSNFSRFLQPVKADLLCMPEENSHTLAAYFRRHKYRCSV